MPIPRIVTSATWAAGSENPYQSPMIVTSYGRGRVNPWYVRPRTMSPERQASHEGEQVPPALEHHQRDDEGDDHRRDAPAEPEPTDRAHEVGEPVGTEVGDRT